MHGKLIIDDNEREFMAWITALDRAARSRGSRAKKSLVAVRKGNVKAHTRVIGGKRVQVKAHRRKGDKAALVGSLDDVDDAAFRDRIFEAQRQR